MIVCIGVNIIFSQESFLGCLSQPKKKLGLNQWGATIVCCQSNVQSGVMASNEVTPSAWINVMLTKNKSVIMVIYGGFLLPYSRYGLLTVSDWVSCRECIFCIVINRPIKGRNKTTKGITIVIVISVYCAQILDLDLSQSTCTWYSRKKYTYFFL